jgi:hypothetical protein
MLLLLHMQLLQAYLCRYAAPAMHVQLRYLLRVWRFAGKVLEA